MSKLQPKIIRLPYTVTRQSCQIHSTLQSLQPKLKELNNAPKWSGAQKAIQEIKKEFNITEIFDNGLLFKYQDRNILLSTLDKFTMQIKQNDKKSFIEFKNGIVHQFGKNTEHIDLEKGLTVFFENIDNILFLIRKSLNSKPIAGIFQRIEKKAAFRDTNAEILNDVINLYNEINKTINSIKHAATRVRIKNGNDKFKSGKFGMKQIDIKPQTTYDKKYSINTITARSGGKQTIITITAEPNNQQQFIIINSNGSVQKSGKLSRVLNLGDKPEYYTQTELDSPLMTMHLSKIKTNLEEYKQYLDNKIEVLNNWHKKYSTDEVGKIDVKTLKLLTEVKTLFDSCKSKMLKIKTAAKKDAFKKKYGIDTIMSSPCLIFRNINEDNESLVLSFPVMKGIQCAKFIMLGRNENIKNSLFVQEKNLVKFEATSLGRSKRTDTKTNYYSQEEIYNSRLSEYLEFAKQRLEVISIKKK